MNEVLTFRSSRRHNPHGDLLVGPMDDSDGIDRESKHIILELYSRLDTLTTHYEFLGVSEDAERRVIRTKYHEFVNRFHPDRYYGRALGAFKPKLERVFQRVTEAHEVLSRPETRAEYDAYLRRERGTRALESTLYDEVAQARELQTIQAGIEAEARTKSVPKVPAVRIEAPRADPEARRRALARKLGRSQAPPPAPAESPNTPEPPRARMPSSETISPAQRAAQELRARYERHLGEARTTKVQDYQVRSEEALKQGNLFEAVNTLRIAGSLAPEDLRLKQRLKDLEQRANEELANRYLEQATYEEREQRWGDAARSYLKAQKYRQPTPKQRERVASCLLSEGTDLRVALENAREAVLATPDDAKFRVTLARTYLAANMRESALGELERAAALVPKDDSIKDLIRRVRRGAV